jgi:hypothetical protein
VQAEVAGQGRHADAADADEVDFMDAAELHVGWFVNWLMGRWLIGGWLIG